ncbi:MAG: amidase [Bacteroidetes bacterium]|jgi:amidase|nr:amidase [Bacteroidota bacterium]
MYNKRISFLITLVSIITLMTSCRQAPNYPDFETWVPYDETAIIDSSQNHENIRLRYKRIQSLTLDKNDLLNTIRLQLDGFTKEKYNQLYPFVFEQTIQDIQSSIMLGKLSYKELTQWYLYRIAITETDKDLGLNAIFSINPNAVEQAEKLDLENLDDKHAVYGMPILLKDNINTENMPTTAGAMALKDNITKTDAQIVQNLKHHDAIILGKVNLSEWANFLCSGCPNGYSAIGGQTLNPYGPRVFDTGGSSSGSAASVAANYAVAAIGSETSGSILSPASQQSVVGLKPTVKKNNQKGIVPISSTLDTPGPIAKTVEDAQIVYSAMSDSNNEYKPIPKATPKSLRLGVYKSYLEDSIYNQSVNILKSKGVHIEELEPEEMNFEGFLLLLNGDMKRDLKSYLQTYAADSVKIKSVTDVVKFNSTDSVLNIPYGQARLDGIIHQDLDDIKLDSIRQKLIHSGKVYFDNMLDTYDLDAVVSINNYNAGQAAVAMYPAITVPMGYKVNGEPIGITFITKSNQEDLLFKIAHLYERLSLFRKPPKNYTQ